VTTPARRRRGSGRSLPLPAMALAVVAVGFFALPFIGLLWRAPWRDAWSLLKSSDALDALKLSITCSLWSTALSILFGVPLAWLLARVTFVGRGAVRALCTLSMVLPPVVGGVALFFALGRRGLVGQWLDRWFDIRLPFTTAAVVVAQTFVDGLKARQAPQQRGLARGVRAEDRDDLARLRLEIDVEGKRSDTESHGGCEMHGSLLQPAGGRARPPSQRSRNAINTANDTPMSNKLMMNASGGFDSSLR